MKAAVTPAYGPADIIQTQIVPTPEVGEHDVLVHVRVAPVTAGDRRLRSADFPGVSALPGRLMMGVFAPRNQVQGTMFAGRVAAVGSAVTRFKVGDDVFGSADHGAYAEFLTVPEDGTIATMPKNVDYDEAAEVPYGAVTALVFLRDIGNVQPGDKVLVLGASGGVGRYAILLAKHLGAEVTAVCSQRNAGLVRELGADHVIDYGTHDFTKNGKKYDVVFDIADATSFSKSRKSLTKTGRYLTLFVSLRVVFHMVMTSLFSGRKAKFGIALGDQHAMEQLSTLLAAGVIRPVIGRRFSLEQISQAHAEAEKGRVTGGVMVMMPTCSTM